MIPFCFKRSNFSFNRLFAIPLCFIPPRLASWIIFSNEFHGGVLVLKKVQLILHKIPPRAQIIFTIDFICNIIVNVQKSESKKGDKHAHANRKKNHRKSG